MKNLSFIITILSADLSTSLKELHYFCTGIKYTVQKPEGGLKIEPFLNHLTH